MDIEDVFTPTCGGLQKVSFGLGHVFNDLCAAMWFSYTLFYLQVVLGIESSTAGILLMIGQIVDSLATPLAGWAIDYCDHKRLWHFAGTISVSVGFCLIFSLKPSEFTSSILFYYALVITIFQIGWAIVQISHLSIIPDISTNHHHSSDLTAIRYTASVCCSITVYLITLIILKNDEQANAIGPDDFYKFKAIALIITFIGLLTSLLFYCGLLGTYNNEYEILREPEDANNLTTNNRRHFLKQIITYLVALMYMASRLFTTLNLIYIPLYLNERSVSKSEQEQMRQTIATIPLVCYVASFATSLLLKFRPNFCTDKLTYLAGSFLGILTSIIISFDVSNGGLYAIAVLLGVSSSSTMVASLCFTANFVKANGYGGGSVYSVVTFTDKLISGGVVWMVQSLRCHPATSCPNYYERVLIFICGGVSLVGLVSLGVLEVRIRASGRR